MVSLEVAADDDGRLSIQAGGQAEGLVWTLENVFEDSNFLEMYDPTLALFGVS